MAIPSPGTYFSRYHTRSFSPFLELSVQLSPCLLALPEHSVHENTSYYSLLYLVLFSSYQLLLLDILYIIFTHHLSPSLDCEHFCFLAPSIYLLPVFVWRDLPGGSVLENLSGNAGEEGSIPGMRRSPGEGNGNTLQYSCLGNPMDRDAWQATYSPGSLKSARSGLATKQYVL